MTYTNDDLLAGLQRAVKKYRPEMHTPTYAETELGVGGEPLVHLTLVEGQVIALCRVADGENNVLCDVLSLATPESSAPYDNGVQVEAEGFEGEPLPLAALMRKLDEALEGIAPSEN